MRHYHTLSHYWVFIKQSDRPDHQDLGFRTRSPAGPAAAPLPAGAPSILTHYLISSIEYR